MLLSLDLTTRQAARVLEQAIRTQAKVELQPRTHEGLQIAGTLRERDGTVLIVDLHEAGDLTDPLRLMGSVCEAHVRLSGQSYLFSTCVLDVPDGAVPGRLLLAVPENIQVANRRRYERTNATVASQARIWIDDAEPPHVGLLASVSVNGLAVNLPGAALDDRVLLGDRVRLNFELAGFEQPFELPAIVCNKSLDKNKRELHLGLEFDIESADEPAKRTHERLRAALFELSNDFHGQDGQ